MQLEKCKKKKKNVVSNIRRSQPALIHSLAEISVTSFLWLLTSFNSLARRVMRTSFDSFAILDSRINWL